MGEDVRNNESSSNSPPREGLSEIQLEASGAASARNIGTLVLRRDHDHGSVLRVDIHRDCSRRNGICSS